MRQPRDRAFYAVEGTDGHPRACHAVVGFQPEGSVEISQDQAIAISAAMRAREVKPPAPAAIAGLSREDVEQLAKDAADRAVAKFAESLARATGGGE